MERRERTLSILGSIALLVMLAPPAHSAGITIATVGEALPVAGSLTMDFPDEPMVDKVGNVVFGANFDSFTDFGIFYKPKKGPLAALGTTMTAITAIGTPTEFDGPAMSGSGIVAFVARGGSADALLRKNKGKKLEILIKTGDPAPGTSGALFVTFDDLSINSHGDTAVIATYSSDGGATTKTGVFLVIGKKILPIVLNGDSLPGTGGTEDGTATDDIDGPWVNDKDDVAFAADLINANSSLEGSVFLKPFKKPIQSLLLMGSAGPGAIGGTITSIGIGRPALNNSDTLSFSAEVSGGSVGSFVAVTSPGSGTTVCAKQGDAAPSTTGTFNAGDAPFGNPSLAGKTLLFHSNIQGDANNAQGIFSCTKTKGSPTLKAVVLPSDTKPTGTWGSGLEEDSLSSKFAVFDDENGSPEGVFVIKLP